MKPCIVARPISFATDFYGGVEEAGLLPLSPRTADRKRLNISSKALDFSSKALDFCSKVCLDAVDPRFEFVDALGRLPDDRSRADDTHSNTRLLALKGLA